MDRADVPGIPVGAGVRGHGEPVEVMAEVVATLWEQTVGVKEEEQEEGNMIWRQNQKE